MKKQLAAVIATAAITTVVVIAAFILLMPVMGPRFIMPMVMGNVAAPSDLDTATTRLTDNGLYRVSFTSQLDPLAINTIHSWTLHVETADSRPVTDAAITVDGGMPQHGHGLPTQPQVTQNPGNGDYLVEGLKFQMTGWWEVKFNITANGQSDSVTFNLVLQ